MNFQVSEDHDYAASFLTALHLGTNWITHVGGTPSWCFYRLRSVLEASFIPFTQQVIWEVHHVMA